MLLLPHPPLPGDGARRSWGRRRRGAVGARGAVADAAAVAAVGDGVGGGGGGRRGLLERVWEEEEVLVLADEVCSRGGLFKNFFEGCVWVCGCVTKGEREREMMLYCRYILRRTYQDVECRGNTTNYLLQSMLGT